MAEQKGIIPPEVRELDITYAIRGLDSGELFWCFLHAQLSTPRYLMFGFVGDDDVEHDGVGIARQPEKSLVTEVTERPAGSISLEGPDRIGEKTTDRPRKQ
jgi:hypothetical protein